MTTDTSTIWVIGSINTDMVVSTSDLPRPGETVLGGSFMSNAGGKGANQAVAAARLGGSVALVACVGSDVFGDQALTGLNAQGVRCESIKRVDDHPSGTALICVDAQGQNQIVVAPGANACLDVAEIEQAFSGIADNSLVLMQLETPLEGVERAIKLASKKNCRTILDPAPAQPLAAESYHNLYLLTPNETEAEALTGITVNDEESALRAANILLERGVQNVALTLGANGALLASSASHQFIGSPAVEAVDTTAAGDCFNGALAVALSEHSALTDAVTFACSAAAIAVTREGAQQSMPLRSEVSSRVNIRLSTETG